VVNKLLHERRESASFLQHALVDLLTFLLVPVGAIELPSRYCFDDVKVVKANRLMLHSCVFQIVVTVEQKRKFGRVLPFV
jgi:hypothetical protein